MSELNELPFSGIPGPGDTAFKELRLRQASDLRMIIGHDGLALPDDLEVNPNLVADRRFDNKYGRLAERLYSGFVAMASTIGDKRWVELAEKPNVQNGCYVLTSVLSYGPDAYTAAPSNSGTEQPGSVEDLGAILKRSTGTLKTFANIDRQSSHTYELNFGLVEYEPVYERHPFIIEADEEGTLFFNPSKRTLQETKLEIARRRLGGDMPMEENPDMRCPAIGRVLTAIWDAGIDECVADPALFEADLSEALAA